MALIPLTRQVFSQQEIDNMVVDYKKITHTVKEKKKMKKEKLPLQDNITFIEVDEEILIENLASLFYSDPITQERKTDPLKDIDIDVDGCTYI